jgi:hypothetical protein
MSLGGLVLFPGFASRTRQPQFPELGIGQGLDVAVNHVPALPDLGIDPLPPQWNSPHLVVSRFTEALQPLQDLVDVLKPRST